jgi:hypothetical protein
MRRDRGDLFRFITRRVYRLTALAALRAALTGEPIMRPG